jgi:hypothetical protein
VQRPIDAVDHGIERMRWSGQIRFKYGRASMIEVTKEIMSLTLP